MSESDLVYDNLNDNITNNVINTDYLNFLIDIGIFEKDVNVLAYITKYYSNKETIEIIRNNRYIKWDIISRQKDVINILDYYKDNINWNIISFAHDLDTCIISKYKEYLNIKLVDKRKNINDELKKKSFISIEEALSRINERNKGFNVSEDNICAICFVNDINIKFLPCKHLTCCLECFKIYQKKYDIHKCMICRKKINQIEKININNDNIFITNF